MFWFAVVITIFIEILCLTMNNLIGLDPRLNIVLGTAIILGIVNAVFCYCTQKFTLCYSLFLLLTNLMVQPVVFLCGGGFHSGSPTFLMVGLLACALHPNHAARYSTFLISATGFGVLFRMLLRHPEMVTPLEGDAFVIDLVFSVLLCAVAITGMLALVLKEIRTVYKEQIREYEKKTRMRMELLESQAESIEDAKRQRNEMRRHNMIVTGFAEKGDIDGLIEYLSQKQHVDEKYNRKKIYCMNSTINSVLGICARTAAKSNIPMEIHTDVEPEIPVNAPDLVTVVSNLVENAIVGAENSGNSEKRVSVDIYTKDGKLVVLCRNTCNPRIDLSSGYPGHPGIGISIVERILRNNGGLLTYQMENGVIQTKLVIDMGE